MFVRDRGFGITTSVDSNAYSASAPALSDDGEYLAFTSGRGEIYLVRLADGYAQLISNDMQGAALDEQAETLVVYGYASLVPEDSNGLTDCLDRLDCRQDPACKTGGGGNSGGGGGKNR